MYDTEREREREREGLVPSFFSFSLFSSKTIRQITYTTHSHTHFPPQQQANLSNRHSRENKEKEKIGRHGTHGRHGTYRERKKKYEVQLNDNSRLKPCVTVHIFHSLRLSLHQQTLTKQHTHTHTTTHQQQLQEQEDTKERISLLQSSLRVTLMSLKNVYTKCTKLQPV